MRILLTTLVLFFTLLPPAVSDAAPARSEMLAQSGGASLNEAVEQVRRQYPNGRIISAETRVSGGREVHHVRVMVDGKVKTVKVNGRKRG